MMPEIPPPPEKVPDYVLYGRRYNCPYLPRPKKLAPEIPAAVHVHPDLESALRAAKRGARYKSGRWYGRKAEGDGFTVSESGTIRVDEEGHTLFVSSAKGHHRYLSVTQEQAQALMDRIANLTTKNQKNYKIHLIPDCFRVGSPLCDNFLSKNWHEASFSLHTHTDPRPTHIPS